MSGAAVGGYRGTYYHLVLTGGPTSWDYDAVHEESERLSRWAETAGDAIDTFIVESIESRKLPIVAATRIGEIEYCYGGIIEPPDPSNPYREPDAQQNFTRCLKLDKHHQGEVIFSTDMIGDSIYSAQFSLVVTARIKREDMDYLAKGITKILDGQRKPAEF